MKGGRAAKSYANIGRVPGLLEEAVQDRSNVPSAPQSAEDRKNNTAGTTRALCQSGLKIIVSSKFEKSPRENSEMRPNRISRTF
jgi:hypothetical protein